MQFKGKPPLKRGVDGAFEVGGQHRHALIVLHQLQQGVDIHIGVAIRRPGDIADALGKHAVSFVKEQQADIGPDSLKDSGQVFLGFANVFVDHAGDIDAHQTQAQHAGQHARRMGLARARIAIKEGNDAGTAANAGANAPFGEHALSMSDGANNLLDALQGLAVDDQVA